MLGGVWLFATPMDCSLPGSSAHGILQAKNTGVGSHSLLQCIFPTQELNWVSCIAGRLLPESPEFNFSISFSVSFKKWIQWICSFHLIVEFIGKRLLIIAPSFLLWRRKWQPTPVFLPGESQGWGSLVGCRLCGRRVGHDWSDLAAAAVSF